ncbi:MAG: TonB-dependent receptor [Bacteroidetes bacterium]|nr:MAG: TonB-dependent receptor [Bacteroidota bacterium]
MKHESTPTNRKALKLNLDTNFYGSFAEIGGGQEVARNFFTAGGASGTIAKTISAYDKSFSDSLYNKNKSGRYVSEGRLLKMLDREYTEVTKLLASKRKHTSFFAFANTVEVLNFSKTNYSHGWMGVKFQLHAGQEANLVILHAKLLENDGLLQQRTLGVLGVNLLYACKNYHQHPNIFLQSLIDNLNTDQLRITMIRMSGPDLDYVDNRLLGVQLVKNGMTRAIMFDNKGNVQQPSEMLYKKNVLAFRGSFRPITYISKDILNTSLQLFQKDEDYTVGNTLSFCEITLNNLLNEGEIDDRDFLERVDMLNQIGQNVMVSEIREYYKLVDFFSQFQVKKLRIVMGVPALESVLDEKYYKQLKGGILEALGKLFPQNLKLYIYPTLKKGSEELTTSKNIKVENSIRFLYQYLQENHFILDIQSNMSEQLHVKAREVLKMIQEGNTKWEKYVPMVIAKTIKEKGLFLSRKSNSNL